MKTALFTTSALLLAVALFTPTAAHAAATTGAPDASASVAENAADVGSARELGLAAALTADPPRRRGRQGVRGRGRAGERGYAAPSQSRRYRDRGGVSLQPYAGRGLDATLSAANVAGVRLGVEPAGRAGFRAFYEQTLDGGDGRARAFGADVLVPVLEADAMSLYGVAGGGYLNPTGERAPDGQFFGTVGAGVRYGLSRNLGLSGELGVRVYEGADGSVATTPAFSAGVGLRF
ncbi:MAG: hypothetical protein ACK41D_03000 [Rubricoccaceae bacterium]